MPRPAASPFFLVTPREFLNHEFDPMSRRSKTKNRPGNAPASRSDATVSPTGRVPGVGNAVSIKPESRSVVLKDRWTVAGICVFLTAIVWVAFGQTRGHEFINFDDDIYVYQNPEVVKGLTLRGIGWAFTDVHSGNWHPLTWLSHMLDCQFYGISPGGHHLTNVLLHALTAILLFLVLRRMTGFLWRSAFVAAVFAVHPLHVESVAWVAERKDVLSGLFFVLTLGAYAGYVRHPRSPGRYSMVALMFTLALMSKPMVVTLPFVLLLLDYWPLHRFTQPEGRLVPWRLIVEKIPLLALSGAICVATLFAQREAITPMPFFVRIGNALVSCTTYLGQMIYPAGLTVYYPHPGSGLTLWKIFAALVLLLAISAGAIAARRKQPWFLSGWLWYLGMLVPVIGVLQVGTQAQADRYTYLPQIGLYVLLTWAAAEWCTGRAHRRLLLSGLAAAVVGALIFCARTQTAYWRTSETLWTRALACTSDSVIARGNLGNALLQRGDVDQAIFQYQAALQIKPDDAVACYNLGNAMLQKGSADEAIAYYQKALEIKPDYAMAHYNLGNVLLQTGSADEAIAHYQKALEFNPGFVEAQNNLGNTFLVTGSVDEAIAHFEKAVQLNPGYGEAQNNLGYAILLKGNVNAAINHFQTALQINPRHVEAHINLGTALLQKGNVDEAIAHYQTALQLNPDSPDALNDLAWVLATSPQAAVRNGDRAVALARRADQLTGGRNPAILRTLAAAYAEAGQFGNARQTAGSAMELARAAGRQDLAAELAGALKLYEEGRPFRQRSQ
jgi:protein O-mannosyl-transferase